MVTVKNESGFTLVELLVVIAILGVIAGIGLTFLKSGRDEADILTTKSTIQAVAAAVDEYKNDRRIGVYPPTSLEGTSGLGKLVNRSNLGIESLVIALNSEAFRGTRVLETYEDELDNLDGDASAKALSSYGSKELFELLDRWGNPFAYFNHVDYAQPNVQRYTIVDPESGELETVSVKPHKNPKTQSWRKSSSFQLFSAGPDGVFNTEDDIGNW